MNLNKNILALKKGSVVIWIDAPDMFKKLRSVNDNVSHVLIDNVGNDPIKKIMLSVFGKVIKKRPKFHLQIDLLYCPQKISDSLYNELKEYFHPGCIIIENEKVNQYFPDKYQDIHFAKLRDGDKEFLFKQVAGINSNGLYLEVGSYKGGSAVLAAIANPNIKVYCVDIWQKEGNNDAYSPFEIWERHTQFFKKIIPLKADLNSLKSTLNKIAELENCQLSELKFDQIFIDGDHTFKGVLTDLNIYSNFAKKICGHDFHLGNSVEQAVSLYYSKGIKKILNKVRCFCYDNKILKIFIYQINKSKIINSSMFLPKCIKFIENNSSIWFYEKK